MKLGVRVIARPEVTAGFALAGLPVTDASGAGDLARKLQDALADRRLGLVLLEQQAYDALPPSLRSRLARQPLPMPVPFPGPGWKAQPAAEAYIVELLRQVIGYRVRLR